VNVNGKTAAIFTPNYKLLVGYGLLEFPYVWLRPSAHSLQLQKALSSISNVTFLSREKIQPIFLHIHEHRLVLSTGSVVFA